MPRETVEIAGGAGGYKSTMLWMMVYKAIAAAEEGGYRDELGPIFVFDSERKMRGVASMLGGVPDGVRVIPTTTIPALVEAVEDIVIPAVSNGEEGYGIIALDMVHFWWEWSMKHYIQAVTGGEKTFADQVLEIAKDRKEKAAKAGTSPAGGPAMTDGFLDWPVIKAWHNGRILEPLLYQIPSHVIASAATREIRTDGTFKDSPKRQALWSPFGEVAEGEKDTDYRFQTILGGQKIGLTKSEYYLTCLKDRSRHFGRPGTTFSDLQCSYGPWKAGELEIGGTEDEPDPETGVVDIWYEFSTMSGAPEVLRPDSVE